MLPTNDFSQSAPSIHPVVVPVVPATQGIDVGNRPVENPPVATVPDARVRDRTTVWDVPFDLVTLPEAVDQIGAADSAWNAKLCHHCKLELRDAA